MDTTLLHNIYLTKAEQYLKRNVERFTKEEKVDFRNKLNNWITTKEKEIDDFIYDFLVSEGLVKGTERHEDFVKYISQKYSDLKQKKILDIGSGRICKTSSSLGEFGCKVTAIDPNIRLQSGEIGQRNISGILKRNFICDEFSKSGKGENIDRFDLLVGLEPCEATEHIIRQGLKYEKPFEIFLCYQAHSALNGTKFCEPEEWYEYLTTISDAVVVERHKNDYIACSR